MPLTFDFASTTNAATPASLSWSHTCTGANGLLLVGVSWRGPVTITGVTYNSIAMTSVGASAGANNTNMQMFRLVGPASGANTIAVTFSAAADGGIGGGLSFAGADQSTPLGTFASASGLGGTATVNVASVAGEIVADTISWDRGTALTVGAGQTQRWQADDAADGDVRGAGSTENGDATVTMSWTGGGAEAWAMGGVSVRAAPEPPQGLMGQAVF